MDYLRLVIAGGVAHFTATRRTVDFDEKLVEFLHVDCDDLHFDHCGNADDVHLDKGKV